MLHIIFPSTAFYQRTCYEPHKSLKITWIIRDGGLASDFDCLEFLLQTGHLCKRKQTSDKGFHANGIGLWKGGARTDSPQNRISTWTSFCLFLLTAKYIGEQHSFPGAQSHVCFCLSTCGFSRQFGILIIFLSFLCCSTKILLTNHVESAGIEKTPEANTQHYDSSVLICLKELSTTGFIKVIISEVFTAYTRFFCAPSY